jgi:chlorophyll(ide) b reductase
MKEQFLKFLSSLNIYKAVGSLVGVVITFFGVKTLFKRKPVNSLAGKSNLGVVITGGSKGIGYEMAKQFLERGHRVVICSRDKKNLEQAVKSLNSPQGLMTFPCDVSKEKDVKNFLSFCQEKLKVIDVFINNAGIPGGMSPFEALECKIFYDVVNTNLVGSMYCSKYALEIMKAQPNGGHLFVTLGFGSNGNTRPGLTTYGTTKWSLVFLGKSLAHECAGSKVGVHRLYPGLTLTDFLTQGKSTVPKEMAWLINVIGDLPENVAKNLVPRICSIGGNDCSIAHTSEWGVTWKFMTSFLAGNKFVDADGNLLTQTKNGNNGK